jgi:hypothetical protein
VLLYAHKPVSPEICNELYHRETRFFAELCCAINGHISFLNFHLQHSGAGLTREEIENFKIQLRSLVPEFVSKIFRSYLRGH